MDRCIDGSMERLEALVPNSATKENISTTLISVNSGSRWGLEQRSRWGPAVSSPPHLACDIAKVCDTPRDGGSTASPPVESEK